MGVCRMILKRIVTFKKFIVSTKRYYEGFWVLYKNVQILGGIFLKVFYQFKSAMVQSALDSPITHYLLWLILLFFLSLFFVDDNSNYNTNLFLRPTQRKKIIKNRRLQHILSFFLPSFFLIFSLLNVLLGTSLIITLLEMRLRAEVHWVA